VPRYQPTFTYRQRPWEDVVLRACAFPFVLAWRIAWRPAGRGSSLIMPIVRETWRDVHWYRTHVCVEVLPTWPGYSE